MTHCSIILLLLLYLISELSIITHKKKFFCVLSSLGLTLISGLRSSSIGYDTENYLDSFHSARLVPWSELSSNFFSSYFSTDYFGRDPGFRVIEKVIAIFTDNDQIYLLTIAVIIIFPISFFIYSKIDDKKSALIAYIYYTFFYFSYIPNSAIRQSITLSIILLAYRFLNKEKYFQSIALIFIASTIHKTALIFLILLFLQRLKLNKVFFKYCIVIYILFLLSYQQLSPYITLLFGDAYSRYASSDYFVGNQRSYTYIIFLTLIYIMTLIPVFKGLEKNFEKRKLFYLSSGIAFVLTPLMLIEPTILRITVYFSVCNFVIIPHSIQLYKPQYSKVIYLSLLLLLVFMGVYSWDSYNFFWE